MRTYIVTKFIIIVKKIEIKILDQDLPSATTYQTVASGLKIESKLAVKF